MTMPSYIGALGQIVEAGLAALPFAPDVLVASFHGMPERTLHLGDPIGTTAARPRGSAGEALGRELLVAFQSRFGRARWLEPATDKLLAELPGKGVSKVAVVARLRRRLPGNARGAGDPRPRHLSRRRRHEFSPISPASTTARRAWRCCALIDRELEGWRPPQ